MCKINYIIIIIIIVDQKNHVYLGPVEVLIQKLACSSYANFWYSSYLNFVYHSLLK